MPEDNSLPNLSEPSVRESQDAILLALKHQEARIATLEKPVEKTLFKRLTENATAAALFLGLVLTFASIRDTFWTKPETDRVSRIGQFNQAVNSAAKRRQDLNQLQLQGASPQMLLFMASSVTPQILNDISTARAILRDLNDADIGIPQLMILISESFTAGDLTSARDFVNRAVRKTDVTPFLHSEAKRYEGKYFFSTDQPDRGRESFEAALSALGEAPGLASARGFVLGDFVLAEFGYGDCGRGVEELKRFAATLKSPQVPPQNRSQMAQTVKDALVQTRQRCPLPQGLNAILPF